VGDNTQQARSGDAKTVNYATQNNVPSLATLCLAGLNVLNANPNGFFAMLEGGAIDQAAHKAQAGRVIEEMHDFNLAVDSVMQWIEKNGGWEENLLIVTSDHETGLITRERITDDISNYWDIYHIEDAGKGQIPDMVFNHGDHSNQLVFFYAKGAGSEIFSRYADEYDYYRGPYLTNSEVGQAMFALWEGRPGIIKNYAPTLARSLFSETAAVGEPFSFTIPQSVFTDPDDGAPIRFRTSIPTYGNWIEFDGETGKITGTPDKPGFVSLTVTALDGGTTGAATETSFRVNINVSGTVNQDEQTGNICYAFPNPAKNTSRLAYAQIENTDEVRLVSLCGKVVYLSSDTSKSYIDIKDIEPGIYIFSIRAGQITHRQQVIIE
jgi:hypothetical protein